MAAFAIVFRPESRITPHRTHHTNHIFLAEILPRSFQIPADYPILLLADIAWILMHLFLIPLLVFPLLSAFPSYLSNVFKQALRAYPKIKADVIE